MFTVSDQVLQCGPRPILPIERKWKSNLEFAPNCPRCASSNTKFCYYNNYSMSQPRYFCKGCRRYWTKGGSLRNVPVGGGCRKNRRGKSSRMDRNGVLLSTNHSKNSSCYGSQQIGVSTSSDGDSSGNIPLQGEASGSDIDLAVVFAKFLTQTPTLDQPDDPIGIQDSPIEGNEGNDVRGSLKQDNNSQIDSSMDCQKPLFHSIPETHTLQEMPQVIEHDYSLHHQELLESDHMNEFELQKLLTDHEMMHDALWSDDAASIPILEWQPMAQLQQFGSSFPVDDHDQLNYSANSMVDYWGNSFDVPGFELLSKP